MLRGHQVPLPISVVSSALAIGLLAWICAPRLSESLSNDELWTMGEAIHGSWHRDIDSSSAEDVLTEIYWEQLGWEHAVWRYESPNHHHLLNVASKGSLTAWQRITGAEDWDFDEVALRLPSFLCSLGAILAWALLFRQLGFSFAALLLPWLLALHPWYQQYATGMRGYALLLLAFPLMFTFCIRALRNGSWWNWLGFGIFQIGMILSWPGAVIIAGPLNLSLALGLWWRKERRSFLKRWLVVNLGSLMFLLPFGVVALFQIGAYLQSEVVLGPMDWTWFRNLASYCFSGTAWPEVPDFANRSGFHISGKFLFDRQPWLFCIAATVLLASFTWGLRQLIRDQPFESKILLVGLLLGPVIAYIKATVATSGPSVFLFPWYFIYLLPLLLGIASIGLIDSAKRASSRLSLKMAPLAALASIVAWLGIYAWVVAPRTLALREHSMDPRRESVVAMRGGLALTDPANAKIITAHVLRSAQIYDPFGWLIKTASNDGQTGTPPGLTQLMRIADVQDLTLFVNIAIPDVSREKYPEIMNLIDESGYFELHSQHFGLEPQFEREVYRYTGGLFNFDFSAPKP